VKPLILKDLLDQMKTSRKNELMNCEQVLATLRAHEPMLKAVGVVHLSLFGSTARGDGRPDSDVDLLAAFDRTRRISLLDVAGIEIQLSELLGQPVDLIEEGTLKPRVRTTVEAEAVRAF
jgi:predicted nucleotidyltransferase